MGKFTLDRQKCGLLIIDVQDKLFPKVENTCGVLLSLQKIIKGMQILKCPILVSEQYPEALGSTVATLKACLDDDQIYLNKTCFSCLQNSSMKAEILNSNLDQWVLGGIEAHVCVLQTARDLVQAGKQVVVLNDAISSRSIFDYSTAIAEMRDMGFNLRISSVEIVLFELMKDSKIPEFKEISRLIK